MIGSGHRSNASIGSFVELNLGADKSFLERFASANSMTLGFSEKSWSLNMSGSREVTDEFSKCVVRLGQAAASSKGDAAVRLAGNGPTQPYNPRDNDAASEGMIR